MSSNPFTADFDSIVQRTLEEWHVPGIAFSVVHGVETYSKGYGTVQPHGNTPIEPSTLFYAGSTTKAQLCAAWALYIKSEPNEQKPPQQRIKFSTPLADIIPEDFVLSDPLRLHNVTLEDALSHRTGLPRHELSYGYDGTKTPKDVTRNLRNLPFRTPLRSEFEYCNIMFVAASHALEAVTGKTMAQIFRYMLWEPLGMKHTYAGHREAFAAVQSTGEVLAKGSTWSKVPGSADYAAGRLAEEPAQDFQEVSGAGFVISTADDYAKWMRCLLSSEAGVLSKDIRKDLWTPRAIVPDSDHDAVPFHSPLLYGLGWFITTYRGHMVYWHSGGVTGAGSFVLLVPTLEWGVTFLSNGAGVSSLFKGVAIELLDRFLGIPSEDRSAIEKTQTEYVRAYQEFARNCENAKQKAFPALRESPTVKPGLPLEKYAGTYTHSGYGTLQLQVDNDALSAKVHDRTWRQMWAWDHVNGEHWHIMSGSDNGPLKFGRKAESKVGVDGEVEAIGIAMETAMPDHLFWFTKTAK